MVTDALIEKKLIELGKKLSLPPSDVKELVPLLDELELSLSRIEQSPPEPIWKALEPIMKHIILQTYLKHPDNDVKLVVASCVSEITRITAPDAPFDDDTMKGIFQLIIGAFEGIHDLSSPSNQRRISILETCAKVRSSVILLDLECEDMILDMFHHFLKNLRSDHPQAVFTSMENIMTLVIEENEDITPEFLSDLLDSLKLDNKDILPIARGLARKVMANSADKIRTCLMRLVELKRIILSEYNEVVATICQGSSEALINMESNSIGEVMEDDNKLSERTLSDELPQVSIKEDQEVACPKKIITTSNGDILLENGDAMELPSSSEQKSERSHRNANSKSGKGNLESAAANQDGASNTNRSESQKTNSSTEKATPVTHTDSKNGKDCHKETDISQDDDDVSAMNVDSEKKHDNTTKSQLNSSKGKNQCKQRAKSKKSKGSSGSKVSVTTTNGALDSKATPLKVDESKDAGDVTNVLKGKDENNSTKKGKPKETEDAGDVTNVLKGKDENNSTKRGKSKETDENNSTKRGKSKETDENNSTKKGKSKETEDAGDVTNVLKGKDENNSTEKGKSKETEDAGDVTNVLSKGKDGSNSTKKGKSKGTEDAGDVTNVLSKGKDENNSTKKRKSKQKLSENDLSENKQKHDNPNESQPISFKGKGQSTRKAMSKTSKGRNAPKPAGKNIDDVSDIHSTASKGNEPQKTEDASDNDLTALKGDESKDNEDAMNVPEGKDESNSSKRGQSKRKLSENDLSNKKQKSSPKKQKQETSEKNVDGEPTLKEFISGHRSASKAPVIDQTPRTKSKSKRIHAVDTEDNVDASVHKENHSLVGSKINVWWPHDEQFYHGVIESYDPDTKKHKILYDDEEIEFLVLKDEIYKLDDSEPEKIVDNQTSQKAGGSSSKLGMTSKGKGVPKTKGETPAAELPGDNTTPSTLKKSKGKTTARTNKSKIPKISAKMNDADNVTPEASKKSKDEAPKAGKSETGAPEFTTPKTEPIKSKSATPKTVSKPKTNSSISKANANSTNQSKAKGNGTEITPAAPENNTASGGKKRSRKGGIK